MSVTPGLYILRSQRDLRGAKKAISWLVRTGSENIRTGERLTFESENTRDGETKAGNFRVRAMVAAADGLRAAWLPFSMAARSALRFRWLLSARKWKNVVEWSLPISASHDR
jgi:hypothetical protein